MQLTKERLRKQLEEKIRQEGFSMNKDEFIVNLILDSLVENYKAKGDIYCPCHLEKSERTICPCAYHQEDIEKTGKCKCGLFVKNS